MNAWGLLSYTRRMINQNDERRIMVVDRELLLGRSPFQGFLPAGRQDYETLILENFRYEPRAAVEEDPTLKQPIAYCMIVNPEKSLLFIYRRAESEGDYAEARLRGKWSIGIGGHIDPGDLDDPNPLHASMLREIDEEIELNRFGEPRILGYINDDVDMVGKVHFGLLYIVETEAVFVAPRSVEVAEAKMITVGEWNEMLGNEGITIEGWSRIATPYIVDALA